ncbi:MAG: hypothetical protein JU82_07555, partial [Sulfuricurvum sp. MLSB]|uniref:hypothetical protein n=1 Tax=Sulfuricurvum sp. MLSB TaxID=1537917 RepID=UPI0005052384
MVQSPDYRLYLEERLTGLAKLMDAHFENVNDKLDAIETQTTTTNHRVNELEDDVSVLKEKLMLHPIECSKAKDIEALKDDLIEYKFFKAHPTWTIIIIAFFVVTLVISSYGTFSTMRDNFKNKELRRDV